MKDNYRGFGEKFCPLCNKMIFPTNDWVYKIRNSESKTSKYYCSYKCWREAGGGNYGKSVFRYKKRK